MMKSKTIEDEKEDELREQKERNEDDESRKERLRR